MAGKKNKSEKVNYHAQRTRRLQIAFAIISLLLVVSMALSLFINI
jgi:predicted nucleic acid-binding Zn ribbon protein